MTTEEMMNAAIGYMKKGVSVIPLKKDKRPYLNSWVEYQKKRADEDTIRAWWATWPDANIGVITGEISGVAVVDIDVIHGGRIDPFPKDTTIVETGNGGFHFYYKYQPGVSNKTGILPGVDIRGDGGYVVAPPSKTEYFDDRTNKTMGGEYRVIKALPFAPWPNSTLGMTSPGGVSQFGDRKTLDELVGVTKGGRNDAMTSLAGKLLLVTKPEDWDTEVYPVLESVNDTYDPPLPQVELRTIYRSICNKESKRRHDLEAAKGKINDEKVKEFLINIETQINVEMPADGEAADRLLEIAKIYAGDDRLESSAEILERIKNEPDELKMMSGWESLDKILKGFRPGQMVIVSGYTKHGKTSWLMDLTDNLMIYNPVWIPLEEGSEDLVRKFKEREQTPPHWFSPRSIQSVSLEWVESRIVEGIAKYNTKAVMIDQLDFIVPLQTKDHHQMIGETVRKVRSIGRKWGVCIFLVCHLNGQAKMTQAPSIENLKGSTSIQQEADTAILVWRNTERKGGEIVQTNETMISVQANRRTGTTGNVRMKLNENGKYVESDWESKKESNDRAEKSFQEL